LVKHNPAHIYFTGRNSTAAQTLIDEVKNSVPTASLTFLELDLSSLATIKPALTKFTHDRLDILMCNAGIMAQPAQLSKDGYEIQFATNHLGHALLIKTLLPILLRTSEQPGSDVRIVCNSSEGWRGHPKGGIQFDRLKTVQDYPLLGKWIRYGQSKVANIVYARELAKRYPGITSAAIHPGVIATPLVTNLGFVDRMMVYLPVAATGKFLTLEQGIREQIPFRIPLI
jgi:NAD(P)-dependent dehydrogenase (short-subunit alcohol dehydrogenase family)